MNKTLFSYTSRKVVRLGIIIFPLMTAILVITLILLSTPPRVELSNHADEENLRLFSFTDYENRPHLTKMSQLVIADPGKARDLAMERLRFIEGKGHSKDMIPFYNIIGVSYLYQAQYNNAIRYFFKTMELAMEMNEYLYLAHAQHNIGLVNIYTEKYKDAIDFLLKSMEIYQMINDTINTFTAMNSIGRIYYEINDFSKAYSYYRQAWNGFVINNHELGISSVANHKAMYFQATHQPDSSLYYFQQSIEYGKRIESNFNLSDTYLEMGDFFYKTGNYEKAIYNYLISDSLARLVNSPRQACFPKLGAALAWLELGNYDKAMLYVEEVSSINQTLNNAEISFRLHETQSLIHESKGNIADAFRHYKLANKQRSILYDQTEIYQVYNVELDHLNRKMELSLLTLEKQELLLGKRKNTIVLTIVISLSLMIILSLLYKFYISKIKQTQKEKLHHNEIRYTFEKNRAAMEAETNERKRLGMELHDGVGPLISLTKLNVTNVLEDDTLTAERQRDLLEKTANSLDEVLREMKQISHNLAPLPLMERGFEYAIKNLTAKIRNLKKHKINININGVDNSLYAYYEHALYRTIQEMLNNIILHADAREINIEILQNETDITVMIEDDGKGFELSDQQQGMGLKSALSRIEGLGGKFLIDSKLGRGTIITAILPVIREKTSHIAGIYSANTDQILQDKVYHPLSIRNIFNKRITTRTAESKL